MIISQTPLRVSFFGGGTDLKEYIDHKRGAVIASSIDKYIYHTLSKFHSGLSDYLLKINYSNVEYVNSVDEINHLPFRKILEFFKIKRDIEIHVASDIPAFTGLGSSSSFTVGLIKIIKYFIGEKINPLELAKLAIKIEQDILNETVGSQDQVIASYGGFNIIEFSKNEFTVSKINISKDRLDELESSLLLIYTGIKRKAHSIEKNKINNFQNNITSLDKILKHVDIAFNILESNKSLNDFGLLLDKTWLEKRNLDDSVSNSQIDNLYNLGINSGAIGGKLLGAGGGGFMLFYVPVDNQKRFRDNLKHYYEVKFKLNSEGSKILFS